MTQANYILAIDQGTTTTRAIIFDSRGIIRSLAARNLAQIFPKPGWIEHDPIRIWHDTLHTMREAIRRAGIGAKEIAAIGVTNQRETCLVWDRESGIPISNAIVWQDRRTTSICDTMSSHALTKKIKDRTGLVLDSYFSATKLSWLLDNVPNARKGVDSGRLLFGTIDTWLVWKLTGGLKYVTDHTNASRTLLFNIHEKKWDKELCNIFGIPETMLPEVVDCGSRIANTAIDLFEVPIPICGVVGDQQGALIGQACLLEGMTKITFGTGCFLVLNTGEKPVPTGKNLLTSIGYSFGKTTNYIVEGSIFAAGAAIDWLRDGLKIIDNARETESLANSIKSTGGVYMIPAFAGLGAPYWDPNARGAIVGLTRDVGVPQIARAALESICYQTRDLVETIKFDTGRQIGVIRVDGGMVENNWLMEYLANTLSLPVERPKIAERTALGAAFCAGIGVGMYESIEAVGNKWIHDRTFEPQISKDARNASYQGWLDAIQRVRTNT